MPKQVTIPKPEPLNSASRPQAVQLEFGDVKGWDVYLAATTEKALAGSSLASEGSHCGVLS